MTEYKHLYLEKMNIHLIELDYEVFNMHKGKYLNKDINRKIPKTIGCDVVFVLTSAGEFMHLANEDGTINPDPINMDDLGDVEWEIYQYGTAYDKKKEGNAESKDDESNENGFSDEKPEAS